MANSVLPQRLLSACSATLCTVAAVKWYMVLVAFILGPFIALPNSYGAGLTDQVMLGSGTAKPQQDVIMLCTSLLCNASAHQLVTVFAIGDVTELFKQHICVMAVVAVVAFRQ